MAVAGAPADYRSAAAAAPPPAELTHTRRVVERVQVSVPGSSANLGPGYDCLGVALPLRNELRVERIDGPLRVEVSGAGADELPADASNLVVRAFAHAWDEPLDGLSFSLRNDVPLRSGGGSSSAAIVAGVAAALALAGKPYGPEALLPPAVELEGHPDNVAAAILGGFTVAQAGANPLARRIHPPEGLGLIFAVPADGLCTQESRRALRESVSREDAVHSLQRAAMLVHLLWEGRLDLLADVLDDRLHEPDRADLAPLFVRLRARREALGCFGVTLSGAGPSVLVWAPRERLEEVAAAVAAESGDARVLALVPEVDGARVEFPQESID